jgi:hypothetical protein
LRAGVIKKPPPIPKKPVNMPKINPNGKKIMRFIIKGVNICMGFLEANLL